MEYIHYMENAGHRFQIDPQARPEDGPARYEKAMQEAQVIAANYGETFNRHLAGRAWLRGRAQQPKLEPEVLHANKI